MPTHKDFATKHLDVRVQAGDEWQALCPYHQDSNPSFSFNIKKGLFICYACGAKGTTRQLAQHLGVLGVPTASVIDIDSVKRKAAELTTASVSEQHVIAPEWLDTWRFGDVYRTVWATRGITKQSVLDAFCLGYNEIADQLVIPVHDPDRPRVTSFIRRNMDTRDGRPKYLYQSGFKISKALYGSWQCRSSVNVGRLQSVAITEGSIDTLAMWEVGIPSVALLGSRVSVTQARLLMALDPIQYVVMTDRDEAGRSAAAKITEVLKGSGIIVSHPESWPEGAKDPGELGKEERQWVFYSAR